MRSTDASLAEAPPRDRRRTDTRDRLLTAALQLFGDKGYAGTTIAEIERAVGLRPGSGGLYRHFASKEALVLDAVHAYHERVRALRVQLADGRSSRPLRTPRTSVERTAAIRTDLVDLVGALANFLAGEGPIVQLSLDTSGLPDAVRHAIGDAWDDGYGTLADLLVLHGVGEDAARVQAVLAIGSLNHYFTHVRAWRQRPAGVDADAFLATWTDATVALATSA